MDNSRILDDLTRVAGGAFTVFSSLTKQIQTNLKEQMGDKFAPSFANDDVTRLQGVVTKLRVEQEELKSRIAELESMLGKKPAKKKTSAAKAKTKLAASKKTTAKTKTKKRS